MTGKTYKRVLNPNFPKTSERRADLLLELELEVHDIGVHYSYELINIKNIPCDIFLESDKIEELTIAILCKVKDKERLLKKIVEKLNSLEEKERADWLTKILTILGLRNNLINDFKKTLKDKVKMPITVSLDAEIVENFPYIGDLIKQAKKEAIKEGLKEGLQKGLQKGLQQGLIEAKRKDIIKLIELKFGSVPQDLEKNINQTEDINELDSIFTKVALAKSIEEINV